MLEVTLFEEEFPGSGYVLDLQDLVRKGTFGTPENEKTWREAEDIIRTALRGKSFKMAFVKLREIENDRSLVAAYGEHITVLRKATTVAFERFYRAAVASALEAHSSGDKEKARLVFELLEDVGEEPFATQARERLARLR